MPRKPKDAPIVCNHFNWYLRRKSSGVYFADGRINSQYNLGKPSLGTRIREEALRRLRDLDVQQAIELGLIQPKVHGVMNDVSINRGWQLYMERCEQPEILEGVSDGTRKRYSAVRDKHVKFSSEKGYESWSEMTKKSTKVYGAWLAKKDYADRTIVLELNLICSVVKWLVEEEHLPPSCRFLLKLSKPDGSTTFCYSKQQVTRMIDFCYAMPNLVWLAQVITALATSGLRINELAKLRWTDIDLPSNTIRLTDERARPRRKQTGQERRIKGKRGRALPMHPAFGDVLAALPRHRDGLIFHGQKGGRLSDRRVLEALQGQVIESLKNEFPTPDGETGFADGTVHGLRHYFCSEAYRNGAKDAELLEWLGHRDSEIMKLYRHLRREDSHRRMEQINFLGSDDEEDRESDVA
jgi:integrase